jgi:hypothetical protein
MFKKILFFSLFLTILLAAIWFRNTSTSRASNFDQDVTLQIESTKKSYKLGEVINLELSWINKSEKLFKMPSVENGYLHIWIASSDQNFKEYKGSNWGNKDSGKGVRAGDTFKTQITLLWNQRTPQNPTVMKDRLATDYVFSTSGVYFIKATASIWNNDEKNTVESEPIQIVVNEPVGDDLVIWNKIKDNGEFAYFMQENNLLTAKTKEREKLQKDIE